MKKFLLKVFYFVLPIIILAYPFDCAISYLLSKSDECLGEFEVMNDVYNSKADCDIAIYGSSRAWVHLDPKIISDSLGLKVYNFGNDGHSMDLQYLRHLEFLKYNRKPTTIVFSVDIFTLQKTSGLYLADQYLPYMLWNTNILNHTKSYNYYSDLEFYIPAFRYVGKFNVLKTSVRQLFKSNSKIRNYGFLGVDRNWNNDFDEVKTKKKSLQIKIDKEKIRLFNTFIKECKKMKINLILLYTPEYIEGQKIVSNRKELIDIYKKFAKECHLKFYDYSHDEICFDKTLFYNASHMNKKGAEIFTSKFASVLKSELKKI